jgi:hypothetical protein
VAMTPAPCLKNKDIEAASSQVPSPRDERSQSTTVDASDPLFLLRPEPGSPPLHSVLLDQAPARRHLFETIRRIPEAVRAIVVGSGSTCGGGMVALYTTSAWKPCGPENQSASERGFRDPLVKVSVSTVVEPFNNV